MISAGSVCGPERSRAGPGSGSGRPGPGRRSRRDPQVEWCRLLSRAGRSSAHKKQHRPLLQQPAESRADLSRSARCFWREATPPAAGRPFQPRLNCKRPNFNGRVHTLRVLLHAGVALNDRRGIYWEAADARRPVGGGGWTAARGHRRRLPSGRPGERYTGVRAPPSTGRPFGARAVPPPLLPRLLPGFSCLFAAGRRGSAGGNWRG